MTIKGENQTFDLEKASDEDCNDSHIAYFDNEFYEDCFIPHYWKNPFIKNFYPSEGRPEDEEFCYASLEFYEPVTGDICYVNFISYADNFRENVVINGEHWPHYWDNHHVIGEVYTDGDKCWLREKYPNILETDPEDLMEKLSELEKIPECEWPLQVFKNYQDKLSEAKEIQGRYDTRLPEYDKEKAYNEYNFFDHVKSFYLNGETMFDKRQ